MNGNLNKKRTSQFTIDLPDDMIQEFLEIGRKRGISVRQQIRFVFRDISRRQDLSTNSDPFTRKEHAK
jgi:hypothetical protein